MSEVNNLPDNEQVDNEQVFVLEGGIALKTITLDKMFLMRAYFASKGTQLSVDEPKRGDIYLLCDEDYTVLWSRDNLYFECFQLERDFYLEFKAGLMNEVLVSEED